MERRTSFSASPDGSLKDVDLAGRLAAAQDDLGGQALTVCALCNGHKPGESPASRCLPGQGRHSASALENGDDALATGGTDRDQRTTLALLGEQLGRHWHDSTASRREGVRGRSLQKTGSSQAFNVEST